MTEEELPCRYASEALMWLITESVNQGSPAFLSSLQRRQNECERHNLKDSNVPQDEDLASFPDIMGMMTSIADIDACIRPILDA